MHPLMLTNGTKFKIGTNSATKREDTICFHPLARSSLERVFLLTSVRTENGLGSGRARPLALELPVGCPSFLLSFQGYVESAKRSYSTSLMLSYKIAIDLWVPLVKAVAHKLQLNPVRDFPKSLSIETESTSASEGKPSCISTPDSVHTNEVIRNFTKIVLLHLSVPFTCISI